MRENLLEIVSQSHTDVDIPWIGCTVGLRLVVVTEIVVDFGLDVEAEPWNEIIRQSGSQVSRPEDSFGRKLGGNRGGEGGSVINFCSSMGREGFLSHETANEIDVETFAVQDRIGER